MQCCIFCGNIHTDKHHISHKPRGSLKKFKYLDYKYNLVKVCLICHREIHDHPMTGKDRQLKLSLLRKLEFIFIKPIYTPFLIQKFLEYNDAQTYGLCKGLMIIGDGYKREDIIRRLMNDQLPREISEVI